MSVCVNDVVARYPGSQTFKFGDNAELSAELLSLVRTGRKTATCGALRDYPEDSPAKPVVGRRDIALEWDDRPALVIETVDVAICRYCDVTEDFALAEGENETLEGWREHHRQYFERNGGFDPKMELLCERFRLIEDLAAEE
ncbi:MULTISPECIES: ASCH domain-containing protein [unclassified Ruegeria]|uniref:ASCH domain-containing protein n=1 Tax=unclassified Ruegeria TaxID=2625375 RepID=UPI00148934E5|nr:MULTISPECIES: ASCH domain-containing protein [unclassified Ruegeria]NOE34669.1 ASCH domain-containing protein [Ruegeria sp. HKCCD7318]